MAKEKFLIIDANSIINRAFYGIRLLTTQDGTYTNGIYGFLNIFYKFKEEIKPTYIAAAFDLKAPTFRHKMYDAYKGTRKPMPEELVPQIPLLKEVLKALGIPILEMEGFEADDIIGTVAARCTEKDIACMILTGDKDDLQLATEDNKIYLVTTRMGNTDTEIFDAQKVIEKYGVTPKEFIDVKAIMGDSSDNIPGVFGIGEKGALQLISNFKSIENLYQQLDSPAITKSVKNKLAENKDNAFLSKTLATIDCHVPITIDFEGAKESQGDIEALKDLYTRLEFKSFLKKLPALAEESPLKRPEKAAAKARLPKDREELQNLLTTDTVFYLLNEKKDLLYVACDENQVVYAPFNEVYSGVITAFFENPEIKKISHNVKEQFLYCWKKNIQPRGEFFDIAIGAYLVDPARKDYDIEELAFDLLGITINGEEGETQLSFEDTFEEKDPYTEKTALLLPLQKILEEGMKKEGSLDLFTQIEMPLVEVLASMERYGILIEKDSLAAFGTMLKEQIEQLTEEIFALAGEEFNINSPKQLGVILFDKLGLKSSKKTKTGYSTNAATLEKLAGSHPIIEKILEYRHLAKLNSTYVEGLTAVISPETGRIHSNFHQTVTVTGRISSSEPNLQNIPIRTALGREMRKMFVASPGYILVDADYSQIELRVLAHIAGDEAMIDAFLSGKDIHKSTAAKIFRLNPDDVTQDMRTAAKAVNFGLIYGKGEYTLAQDLGISLKESRSIIEDYLGSFTHVRDYMKNVVEDAKEKGYVTTLFGRRRRLPELASSNFQLRAFGERAALNTPIQGTAADIIKLAMVRVYNRLKKEDLGARLILQVHDELIVECPTDKKDMVGAILKEEMENAYQLSAPLLADMHTGHSWFDAK